MAESLLPFVVERLWKLLVRESERSQGFDEKFKVLKSDVQKLRCFLEDADAKRHTKSTVRNTIKEIKEVVLDAEDIVETFLLEEELRDTSGVWNSVRRFPCVILERRKLAFDTEAISKRISKVIQDMHFFGVQEVIVSERCMPPPEKERQTYHTVNEEDPLVGLEKNIEDLVGYLVEEDSSQVVSLTGMGGIGKTTLARKAYNHETIKSHFLGSAWVCVSQQFTRKDIWQTILQQLRPEMKVLEMTEQVLQANLVGVLETQKTLVVIDDIWREEDWDRIKDVFLPKKGWKVLITSRNEKVAVHADRQCIPFKLECLTPDESWDLFKRIAFPMNDTSEVKIDEKMEMGKKMIEHCGGLPLAVKVLGGLLAPKYTLHEWESVNKNIGSHIIGGTSVHDKNISLVYNVLYLSFEELPVYLKQCFLYLAHFPEDYEIDVKDLSYYWAAEGIPRPRYYDGESNRDVADGYIEELVKRNMVISERDVDTSRFERCQLHDMMREVCLHRAEEENFLQIIQDTSTANSKSPCKSRRLAVHDKTFNVETEVKNPSLRSLLFIKTPYKWKATGLFLTRHKLMRVLDISGVMFEGGKVPSSIGKLIHLRYLSLKDGKVTHLPSSMRNLKQLLYLNLHVYFQCEVDMPNILKDMRELTYLYLPKRLHDEVKMEMGNLVKLETLKNFSTKHGNVSDLKGMTRLRNLSIRIEGKGCNIGTLSASLSKITHLENLSIINRTKDDEGFVLDSVHLKKLNLWIYMPRLPDETHFPCHLTTINLTTCRLEEDPMPILEKLGQLKEVCLRWESFSGRRMVCSRGGFPQLHKLELWGLQELEEWIVEEGSMPRLRYLVIEACRKLEEWIVEEGSMPLLRKLEIIDCEKLKEIPDGLRFITSLEDLSVNCGKEGFKLRLSEGCLPSYLTTIELIGCSMEEDPLPILEKFLHLEDVTLDNISFSGRRMVCSKGGFPQLEQLELMALKDLEEWIVEEGSMPLLRILRISHCKKLKEIPDGLQFITSLKHLDCFGMRGKWRAERLLEGGEDYYKVQHIPFVTFLE